MVAKLRDTLAHEICHCALWVINNDPKSHHGKAFKEWSVIRPPDLVHPFLLPFSPLAFPPYVSSSVVAPLVL